MKSRFRCLDVLGNGWKGTCDCLPHSPLCSALKGAEWRFSHTNVLEFLYLLIFILVK